MHSPRLVLAALLASCFLWAGGASAAPQTVKPIPVRSVAPTPVPFMPPDATDQIPRWEYAHLLVTSAALQQKDQWGRPNGAYQQFDQTLQRFGEEGWELVSAFPDTRITGGNGVVTTDGRFILIFKRRKR